MKNQLDNNFTSVVLGISLLGLYLVPAVAQSRRSDEITSRASSTSSLGSSPVSKTGKTLLAYQVSKTGKTLLAYQVGKVKRIKQRVSEESIDFYTDNFIRRDDGQPFNGQRVMLQQATPAGYIKNIFQDCIV